MLCGGQSTFAKHFCSLVWFCLNLRQVNLLKDGSELMLLLTVSRPGSHVLPCLPLLVHSPLHCARGAEPVPGASNIPGRPHIYPMPENPLELLRQLHGLLKASHSLVASSCFLDLSSFMMDVSDRPPLPALLTLGTSLLPALIFAAAGRPAEAEVSGGAAQRRPAARLLGAHAGSKGVRAGGALQACPCLHSHRTMHGKHSLLFERAFPSWAISHGWYTSLQILSVSAGWWSCKAHACICLSQPALAGGQAMQR